jgi:hypothetical protein
MNYGSGSYLEIFVAIEKNLCRQKGKHYKILTFDKGSTRVRKNPDPDLEPDPDR